MVRRRTARSLWLLYHKRAPLATVFACRAPYFSAFPPIFLLFSPRERAMCRRPGPKTPLRKAERVFDVFDAICIHFQHVEAHAALRARAHLKIPRDLPIAAALVRPHRLGRGAERVRKARLHLAEDDRLPVPGDDVRLAEGRAVIAGEQFVPLLFQVLCGPLFAPPPESFFVNVLRWIAHNPYSRIAAQCAAVPYPLWPANPYCGYCLSYSRMSASR